jgi:hypothetical protein
MINSKERLKLMSIINICNVIINENKDAENFWVLKIKEISEELLK